MNERVYICICVSSIFDPSGYRSVKINVRDWPVRDASDAFDLQVSPSCLEYSSLLRPPTNMPFLLLHTSVSNSFEPFRQTAVPKPSAIQAQVR